MTRSASFSPHIIPNTCWHYSSKEHLDNWGFWLID